MTNLRKTKFFQHPFIKKPLVYIYMKYLLVMALVLPDKIYLKWRYKKLLGKKLNLKHPTLFQEKLHWLKLHDRKSIYHQMVDKYEMKNFIAQHIGSEYVIPTLAVYNNFDEIDFDKLPNQFILKCTFDSGSYCICKDKSKLNIKEAKKRLMVNWKHDYYIWSREWPYKGLKHRIIAEPLVNDGKGDFLTDYKFYTFHGEPKFFYITSNRGSESGLKEDFFDVSGNLMELNQEGYYNNPNTPKLPINLSKMVEFSRVLAKGTYHLRVDFYEVGGKLYCGELTFFDGGGWCNFTPEKYNRILGDWIKLPNE